MATLEGMDTLLNKPKSATWFLRAIFLSFWPLTILNLILEFRIKTEPWTTIALVISILPAFLYVQACFSIIPNLLFFDDLHLRKFTNKSDLNWILFHSRPKLIILHPSYFIFAFFTGGFFSMLQYFLKIDPILRSMIKNNDY